MVQENVQFHFEMIIEFHKHDLNFDKNMNICLKLYYIIIRKKVYEEELDFLKRCFLGSEIRGIYFLFIFLPFLECLQQSCIVFTTRKKWLLCIYVF